MRVRKEEKERKKMNRIEIFMFGYLDLVKGWWDLHIVARLS